MSKCELINYTRQNRLTMKFLLSFVMNLGSFKESLNYFLILGLPMDIDDEFWTYYEIFLIKFDKFLAQSTYVWLKD